MKRATFLALLLATPTSASGEDQPADQSDAQGVVVTTSARAPITEFESTRSTNLVGERDLAERQPTSLVEALEDEPGVTTQSTNRGAGTLILRGLVGPENLIIVDGVRFNQSTFRTGPNQYLDTIDPWGISAIEVVRGPAGVLYGTGALGGVVEVSPIRTPDDTFARGRFGFHSADRTASAAADAGTTTGPLAATLGVTARRHGVLRVGSSGGNRREIFASGLEDGRWLAPAYDDVHLRASLALDAGPHRFRANYQGALVRDATRVDRLGRGEVRVYDNDDHLTWVSAELDGPRILEDVRVNVSWHRTSEVVVRDHCDVPVGEGFRRSDCLARDLLVWERTRENADRVDTFGTSATAVSGFLGDDLQLTWGADAYFDDVDSERSDGAAPDFELTLQDRGNFADGSSYRTIGLFALSRYDFNFGAAQTLRPHVGARLEHFGAHAPADTPEIGDVRYGFTGVAGTAGVSYLTGTTLNLYANWNQGYRAPNLQETTVLGDSGNFFEVPNPTLGPERSDTFELGARADWADILILEPAIWVSLLSDRIVREPATFQGSAEFDGKPVRQRVNRDSAYFVGTDLSVRTHAYKGTSLFGAVSWIDGAVESAERDDTFVEGPFHGLLARDRNYANPRRLPPVSGTFGVRYQPDRRAYLVFYVSANAAQTKLAPDDRADLRICEVDYGVLAAEDGRDCGGTAGWVTFNARAGYAFEHLKLDVAALNLTDERYRRHGSGVVAAGFDLALQATIEY